MPPMSRTAQVLVWLYVLWAIGLFFVPMPNDLYLYLPISGPVMVIIVLTTLDWLWKHIPHP